MNSLVETPGRYFVCSGTATSTVSSLNAFDQALIQAGIAEQNLVPVSSVLPEGIQEIKPVEIPHGAITHCVLAQERGTEGETISAGLAYGFRQDGKGWYVAEGHGNMGPDALTEILEGKLDEIAKHRDIKLERTQTRIESLEVPMNRHGASIVALVFLP